jgi:hypothetical protein
VSIKKKKRAVAAGRMAPATIAAVVAEIKAYGQGERDEPLSWAALEAFSGFSHVSLWKKPAIKAAFQEVRQAQRADATPISKPPRTSDERVLAMQAAFAELRDIVRAYDEQWALYEHNMQRLGIDPDELRRPLDPIERNIVKSRHMRSVR